MARRGGIQDMEVEMSKWKRSDDPRFVRKSLAGEMSIFDEKKAELHMLNPTACHIYELCAEARDLEEIVDSIVTTFSPPPEVDVTADARQCLEQLRQLELLVEA